MQKTEKQPLEHEPTVDIVKVLRNIHENLALVYNVSIKNSR